MKLMFAVIVVMSIRVSITYKVHIDVKGIIQDGKNITLECKTDAPEITFSINRKFNNGQNETIAECEFRSDQCYFLNGSFLPMYNISSTNYGGILTIYSLSVMQQGEYTCFYTYNSSINATVHIEVMKYHDARSNAGHVIAICVGVGVVIIICVAVCIRRKQTCEMLHTLCTRTDAAAFPNNDENLAWLMSNKDGKKEDRK